MEKIKMAQKIKIEPRRVENKVSPSLEYVLSLISQKFQKKDQYSQKHSNRTQKKKENGEIPKKKERKRQPKKKNDEGRRQIKEEEVTRFNFPSSPIKTAKRLG